MPYAIQDARGNLWLTYDSLRSGNWDVYLRRYNGTGWMPEERLTNNTFADVSPALVQLPNGNILLVWASNRTGNFSLYYKTFGVAGWSAEYGLTSTKSKDSNPNLLQLRNGTLWVFWTRETVSGTLTIRDIYYKAYTNSAWGPERQFTTGGSEEQPSLLQSFDGTIWVAYAANRLGNLDIFYRSFNGTTWSPETPLTTSILDDRQPWLMQDLTGTLWLFWTRCVPVTTQFCEDDVFYKTSSNLGGSWSSEVQFTIDPTGSVIFDSHPSVVHANDSKIYVFWVTNLTGLGVEYDVYLSTSDPVPFHDVGISSFSMSPDKPRSGETFTVSVLVQNIGSFPENVTLKITLDGVLVTTSTTTLPVGQAGTFSYTYSTQGWAQGYHYLRASVGQVPGELRTSNNVVATGFFILSPGDVNRDGFVNFVDLGLVGAALYTKIGDPLYNPQADLNRDGRIDFLDQAIVGSTFGSSIILPPDYNLASNQYYFNVVQGFSVNATISVSSISGYASAVLLKASGIPAGVKAVFSNNLVTPPGSSTLTLYASSTATVGNFTLAITGTNGTVARSLSLYLLVKPPGDFGLAVTPSSLLVVQGASVKTTVTLTSLNGFSSPVSLTFTGLPSGLTFLFDSNPAAPPPNGVMTLGLSLSANSTAPAGIYTVMLTGTSGSLVHSVIISLKVCVPIPGDVNKDGVVNFIDLGLIGQAFLSTPSSPNWNPAADLNKDGVVNFLDLGIVGQNFLRSC